MKPVREQLNDILQCNAYFDVRDALGDKQSLSNTAVSPVWVSSERVSAPFVGEMEQLRNDIREPIIARIVMDNVRWMWK